MSPMMADILANVPTPGGYISPAKIVTLFVLALPWLWGAGWVDKDTRVAHMPKLPWIAAVLGAGLLGMIVWLLVPMYAAGLGVYIVLVATAFVVYVMQRNAKVVPEARVLTGAFFQDLFKGRRRGIKLETRLKIYSKSNEAALPPTEGTLEEQQVYNRAQDLLYEVFWRRASEVDLTPTGEDVNVRMLIDGVVEKGDPVERPTGDLVIDYIKGLAGMDMEDRRRPQEGKITVDLAGEPMEIMVACAGTTTGQRMQLKVVKEAVRTRITELGMFEDLLERVREIAHRPTGLMIIAAQPGNGLTSTLYSLLRDNDPYIHQLVTIEMKPDADLENITQHHAKSEEEMPRLLASAMRRDPDYVMVDRCANRDGAEAVLTAAKEKKVFLGVHARDSFAALAKWVKLVADVPSAVEPLQAILSQVLLRKLCPTCRESYKPDAEMLRKANLPMDKVEQFHRPPSKPLTDEKGRPYTCPTCQGSGYLGRMAAFELLEIDDDLRELMAKGGNLTQIKAAARKKQMLYLQEQGLRHVMAGDTSVQEVIRVTRTKQE